MMDCAAFENGLTRLLDEELALPARSTLIGELERHARDCCACAGAAELVELLSLPPGERDVAGDPPEEYWEALSERSRSRRAADDARPMRRPGLRIGAASGLAAALLLVAWGLWISRPAGEEPPGPAVESSRPGEAGDAEREPLAEPAGPPLEIGRADGSADGGWLFPGTDRLDPDTSRRLLEWLREQESNEGAEAES